MSEILKINEIPSDFEEMIDAGEHICGDYSNKFDKAMIDNGLFEHGFTRRSHRIITKKCHELGYNKTIELLTNKTFDDILLYWKNESDNRRISAMMETAEEFGYKIEKLKENK